MRIHFSCMGGGFSIEAGGILSRYTIKVAIDGIEVHLANCPYCRFKKDPLTNRDREGVR